MSLNAKEAATRKDGAPPPVSNRSRKRKVPLGFDTAADEDLDEVHVQPSRRSTTVAGDRQAQVDHELFIARMNPALLADHFGQTLRRHTGTSDARELESRFVPARAFVDTSAYSQPHLAPLLPLFLEQFTPRGRQALSSCPAIGVGPHTLVITSSGIRAAHLTRVLRTFATDTSKIAKLFAKHMKLSQQVDFLKQNHVAIGIGTPARIKDLLEHQAISAEVVVRIVVDGSYVDEKKRTIFDMGDIFMPIVDLLSSTRIRSRLGEQVDGVQVLVF